MERIWWDNIPNAAHYVREISDAVHEERSMVLILPPETPWRAALAQIVEEKLADIPDRSLRRISSPEGAPGEYLLRRYCKKERQLAYRGTTSHAEFLAKEEESVLHAAILWLEIERPEEALAWVDFISAYQGFAHKEAPRPSFILVLSEECDKCRGRRGIQYDSLAEKITEFDRYAFAILAASDAVGQRHLKVYLANLAATVCGDDIELSAACSRRGVDFLRDPQGVLRQIAETGQRSDGTAFDIGEIGEDISRLIWRTQVKLVFPIIEDRRQHYVEELRAQLEARGDVPEEVEIGPLCYLAGRHEIQCTQAAFNEIEMLKNARNALAHLSPLPFEMVDMILRKQ